MTTYIHKFKCRSCGLHFVVYSWQEGWTTVVPGAGEAVCPECGRHEGFIRWLDETDQQIFQLVPGDSAIVGLT